MPRSNGLGKRMPLNMRTTRELRRKVEKAAAKSGRSLVQEVEHRVEQSFARDQFEQLLNAALDRHFAAGSRHG